MLCQIPVNFFLTIICEIIIIPLLTNKEGQHMRNLKAEQSQISSAKYNFSDSIFYIPSGSWCDCLTYTSRYVSKTASLRHQRTGREWNSYLCRIMWLIQSVSPTDSTIEYHWFPWICIFILKRTRVMPHESCKSSTPSCIRKVLHE